MLKYLPVQNERLFEQIVVQIEARILAGDLKKGDQLPPERELADQFKVSRTAVREAVKILREKGLIEIRPGRGTFVTDDTPQVMRQSLGLLMKIGSADGYANLIEVREILESEIAALAATRMTDECAAAMQEAYLTMEAAFDNADLFIEADLDFHLALAEATLNPLIPALLDTIVDILREQLKRAALVVGGLHRSQFHHKKILEAVIRHDPLAARQAMRDHLEQVRKDLEISIVRTD